MGLCSNGLRLVRERFRCMAKRVLRRVPLALAPGARAHGVSVANRVCNLLFGSPNWRRGFGVVSARGEFAVLYERLARKARSILGLAPADARLKSAPVFAIDRRGVAVGERLPRIWLSERAYNSGCDNGRRVFVECYPSGPDPDGSRALELAEGCLGEGADRRGALGHQERRECFKAAEILLIHSVMRGNRTAVSRLTALYCNDLCDGDYWQPYIVERSRHSAKRRVLRQRSSRSRVRCVA